MAHYRSGYGGYRGRRTFHDILKIVAIVLAVLVVLNVLVIVLPVLNLYLCFLTAPMFLFLYIALHKAVSAGREQGVRLPGALRVLPPVFAALYLLSAVAAVFSGL